MGGLGEGWGEGARGVGGGRGKKSQAGTRNRPCEKGVLAWGGYIRVDPCCDHGLFRGLSSREARAS